MISHKAQQDRLSSASEEQWLLSTATSIRLATRLAGYEVDRLRLHESITNHQDSLKKLAHFSYPIKDVVDQESTRTWQKLLESVAHSAGVEVIEFYEKPDPARLPTIVFLPNVGWGVVIALNPQNEWVINVNGQLINCSFEADLACVRLSQNHIKQVVSQKPVFGLFKDSFWAQQSVFRDAVFATIAINLLALMISLYSMQVYDRVIPTQGYSTLLVLTLGVFLSLIIDLVIKVIRSHLMEFAVVNMDKSLSRIFFSRLLNIRLDQLPSSVGTLSAQLRSYETIRSFLSSTTFYIFVDAPFGVFFILMITLLGAPILALVPLIFLVIAIAFGVVMKNKIDAHAKQGAVAGNLKTGLLVEAIEGAETIKSGAGAWGVLSKWLDVTNEAMHHEISLKRLSEKSSYITAMFQQISYISLIAFGAYLAAEGQMTMGALIACSILSGRILAPVAQIPSLLVQLSQSKVSLEMLEKVYALETDNHGIDRPLLPENIKGKYDFERVNFSYGPMGKGISIDSLKISPGEKVGVIGPIGSGKSTLLRLLSGMYQVNEGRVLLDDLDLDQISRSLIAEKVVYLQQDYRMFSGTLRENLLIGIPNPGDDVLMQVASKTGLSSVIAASPKGLDLPIAEGGKGLSGGQKQLVAYTRLLLMKPRVWLLDEPTASMDAVTEKRCVQILKDLLTPADTLVLVTHKSQMLELVDRLIVVANHRIVLDGSRDEVMKKLSQGDEKRQDQPTDFTSAHDANERSL